MAAEGSARAALRLVERLEARCRALADNPGMGGGTVRLTVRYPRLPDA